MKLPRNSLVSEVGLNRLFLNIIHSSRFQGWIPVLRRSEKRHGYAGVIDGTPVIALPTKAFTRCYEYLIYYVAHELAHHAHGGLNHGPAMREVELNMLKPFRIGIDYKGGTGPKAWYPARLVCLVRGDTICDGQGRRRGPDYQPKILPLPA